MAVKDEAPTELTVVASSDGDTAMAAPSKDPAHVQTSTFGKELFTYLRLLFYADPTRFDILLLVVGTLSAAASGVPFPVMGIIFGQLLDDLNDASCKIRDAHPTGELQSDIDRKVLILVAIAIGSFLAIFVYAVSWGLFSRRLEARLRDRYFTSLLRQDATFYDTRQAGELSSRLNADIQTVQTGTSEKVGICIGCFSFFVSSYVVAFIRDPRLAAILICLIPAFLIMAGVGSVFTQRFATRMSDHIASASSIAQESLSHIAVVQAFGAGPRLEAKFASRMIEAQGQGIKKAITAAVQAGSLYFIAYSANGLAFWQGSKQIAQAVEDGGGDVSVGRVYTVIFLLVDACIILGSIAPLLPLLGAAAASFKKLRVDIDSHAAIDSQADTGEKLPISVAGSVEFRRVSFAYVSRPDKPVLKRVSFHCPVGKHTALVGLSGSGKSTVAGLLARIYDPTEGSVHLDGHDLRALNVKNLRSFMSLVQQEPSLLDRSILENIALGVLNSPWPAHERFQSIILGPGLGEVATSVRDGKNLTDIAQSQGQDMADLVAMVREAASLADASGFIDRMENGYGTEVGTGGRLVSGGQRQRIALARALIRNPKILILDEATASLDSASERRIQMAIESIAKDRTLIAIAHRLSTIKNADNIIVMNNGEIIEQGTHLELMALDGSYAGMVRLQNIESEQHDDAPSITSTARGEADAISTEKDSMLEEKAAEAEKAQDKEPGTEAEVANPAAERHQLESTQSAGYIIKHLSQLARPNLGWLVLATFASVIAGASFTGAGPIFGNTIGSLSPCNPADHIRRAGNFFGGMFFMLACVEFLANSTSWSGFGYVAEKLLYRIRVLCFRSLYEQGMDWHQSGGRTPASLLSVITADAAAIGGFSGSIMGTMFSIVVNFLIAITVSHILNWKIAIVCLVTVPILLGSGILQLRALSRFERKHSGAFSNAIGITVEAVNSFKTISSLSLEQEVLGSYRRALRAPQKEMALASAHANLWLAISNSTGAMIYAFAYWWGSTRITMGEATPTQFFTILVSMLVSAQLWGNMFTLAPEVSRAREAGSRILGLLDIGSTKSLSAKDSELVAAGQRDEDVEASGDAAPKSASGNRGATVVFRDVSFAYPARADAPILQNVSFTIQAGQFCGLVGPSGAGKSTIMSLVQRLYYPTSGTVELNGMDICSRDGTGFRDDIAVVPQDCALFDGTVKFNVGLGATPNHEATDAEIEEACRLANIHDTIMAMPMGYGTECGPNGSRMSGGQRQRLAIARALVRKPRLLLLDESTSALDAESEKELQEGLERAAKGITVIAITHRLHTVRKANVIFVVEGGKVVDKGRHEELVEKSETASSPTSTPTRSTQLLHAIAQAAFTIPPPAGLQHPSSDRGAGPTTHSAVTSNRPSTGGHRERGGSAQIDDSLVHLPDADAYELSDYRDIQVRARAGDRESRRRGRREHKRRWLETQDEMKFSHSIQFNAVPDWSSHYIAYSNLKKLIYYLEKSVHQSRAGDSESRPLIANEEPEEVFSKSLGVELEKISSFYVAKEGELLDEVNRLLSDVEERGRHSMDGPAPLHRISSEGHRGNGRPASSTGPGSDDEDGIEDSASDDETTGLTKVKGSNAGGRRRTVAHIGYHQDLAASSELGRSARRHSTTFDDYGDQSVLFAPGLYSSGIMLKKRIISLYVQLCELKSYAQLNKTGFSKVLKKFDKILDKELKAEYMRAHVDTAYPFRDETKRVIEENIAKMETAYTDVVTGGDSELAKRDLRSHLREHVVWERNTVWRELIGIERRGEAARLGQSLLGQDQSTAPRRLQGDDDKGPAVTQIRTPLGRVSLPVWLTSGSMLTLVVSVAIFFVILFVPMLKKPEQQNCLALLVFISLLWATETIPLFATALLIPFLSVVLRVVREEGDGKSNKRLNSKEATEAIFASMWTPVIMLLLGGFTLAAALSKCKIDKRLAMLILSKAGTQPRTVLVANMFVAAFASMLISNVAAPVLCYSIIEPMLRTLPSDSSMSKAVIIGIALSSNIGGMLSPIASPQNVVAMGIMKPEPTWLQWFFIVIPVGVVSIVLIWLLLLVTFRPSQGTSISPIRPLKERFTGVQWFVTIVAVATIALWCGSHRLEGVFGDMGVIAIIPIVLFFGIGILTKEDFNNFPWTIIILAAGGLSLGKAVRSSGLLHTLAGIVSENVEGMSLYGVLVVFSALILVIATFISHTVAALILLPLVFDVGMAMEQPHPNLLVMGGVLMCSAAMGLPTSGFPNMTAIMKEDAAGQRYLRVRHFISRGVPSSIITLVVVLTLGYGLMEVAGLD
ncbi:Leptomycin B resistance protein [Tolypocladium capitatum]|uniref:Leptomycin B resistance protein n=1 Tax=Tolypocladium capitatum TaxID=45235 RepID=A0A2K3QEP7_9HYPO|nr:Leptomycin B resistance protein [Tolypocladium capitatum]